MDTDKRGYRQARFTGKVVIITGSTAGIGLGIAKRVAAEGACDVAVVISSRKQDAVDRAVEDIRGAGGNATGVVCHVGNAEHRERLIATTVKKYGRIDSLISNAVVNPTFGPLLDTPDAAVDKILDVNIKAALLLCKAAVPHMGRGASIVLVTSIAAYNPEAPLALYGVSKTALLGLVKALAAELGPSGIRVNGLAPGIVPTKFSEALVSSKGLRDAQVERTALKRLGTVADIAGAAAFLASDDAAYVTAETLVVAGGMHSKL